MKHYSFIYFLFMLALSVQAQTINVHMKNGEVVKYNSPEVDYIDFTGTSNPNDSIVFPGCPDSHHPHIIDLGLPSGTKWACCNVGATSPEKFGGYFAWGETSEKSYYGPSTYLSAIQLNDNEEYDPLTTVIEWDPLTERSYRLPNFGTDISGTQYDVATVRWGNSWQMPTWEQCWELIHGTSVELIEISGIYGIKFTGSNGASIFLPDTGYKLYGDFYGIDGPYWSSTLCEDTDHKYIPSSANTIVSRSGLYIYGSYDRIYGCAVRPVHKIE